MGRRYSDIERGAELQAAYTALQTWRAKSRAQKVTDYNTVKNTTRVAIDKEPAWISPFNVSVANLYYKARNAPSGVTSTGGTTSNAIRGLVDTRFEVSLPTTGSEVYVARYKFAKIIGSERTATATAASNSRITNTPYKRHRSNNVSFSFGQIGGTSTESFDDAVKAIKAIAGYGTFTTVKGNRIGFVPEGN